MRVLSLQRDIDIYINIPSFLNSEAASIILKTRRGYKISHKFCATENCRALRQILKNGKFIRCRKSDV